MNRFTFKKKNGDFGLNHYDIKEVPSELYGAICKLKDYEETGLTPDQIYQINELYSEREVDGRKRGIEMAKMIIQYVENKNIIIKTLFLLGIMYQEKWEIIPDKDMYECKESIVEQVKERYQEEVDTDIIECLYNLTNDTIDDIERMKSIAILSKWEDDMILKMTDREKEAFAGAVEMAIDYNLRIPDEEYELYKRIINLSRKQYD